MTAAEHTRILQIAQARVDKLEPRLASIIERILLDYGNKAARNFERHVTHHLTAADGIIGNGDWTAPFPDQLIDVDALVEEILSKTQPIREALIRETMTPALQQAGLNFDTANPLINQQIANTGSQVKNIADTTRANIMNIVGQAASSGLTIPQTSSLIQQGMATASKSRATMIARTELGRAVSGGSLTATQMVSAATGDTYNKTWQTSPGANYPRHEDYDGLDGQTVGLEEAFDVGGEALQYPGDENGDPSETINCRCAMTYMTPTGEQEADAESPPELDTMDTAGGGGGGGPMQIGPPAGDTVSIGNSPPVPEHLVNRIDELNLDKPLGEFRPTSDVGRQIYKDATSTQEIYAPAGDYIAERQQLHDEIVASFFKDKVAPEVPGDKRFFTAGGGASGKSHAVFNLDGQEVSLDAISERPDWITVDPDAVKKMLPEYQALNKEGDLYAANGVHEESSDLANRIVAEAEARGYNVVTDTTGSSSHFLEKLDAAKAAGHETQVTMFSIPTNRAIERSIARAENPDGKSFGRYVATQPLKKAHAGASRNLAMWQDSKSVDAWRVYDNSGAKPVIVAAKEAGADKVIYDQNAFNDILGKADETPGSAGATFAPVPVVTEVEPMLSPTEAVRNMTHRLDSSGADIDAVMASLSNVIQIPEAVDQGPITAKIVGEPSVPGAPGVRAEGLFNPLTNEIEIRRLSSERYSVVAHEFGHAVDHATASTFTDEKGLPIGLNATDNVTASGLDAWAQAITESPTFLKIDAALKDGFYRAERAGLEARGDDVVYVDGVGYYAANLIYVLNPAELFARSFTQYMAQTDDTLATHVAEQLGLERHNPGMWYWPPDEFAPIAAALHDWFEKNGMLVTGAAAAGG